MLSGGGICENGAWMWVHVPLRSIRIGQGRQSYGTQGKKKSDNSVCGPGGVAFCIAQLAL